MSADPTPTVPAAPGTSIAERRQALREALVVALAALLLVVATGLGLWLAGSAAIRGNYRQHLVGLAQAAAVQVDPGLHDSLREPSQRDGADYLRAVAPLRRLRAAVPEVRFIYTVVPDGNRVRFVLDADEPGDHDGDGRDDRAAIGEVFEGKDPADCPVFGVAGGPGVAVASGEPATDKWGTFMTGWAPLRDANGRQFGVLGVDVDARIYTGRLASARRWMLFGLLPAGLLVAGLAVGFFRIRLRGLEAARRAIEAGQVLAMEQERLRSIVEGTAVGTWEARLDADHIHVDERWAGMIGRTPAQLGRLDTATFLSLVHPDDRAPTRAAIIECLRVDGRLLEYDLRMRHAEGHWVWIRVRGKVIERAPGGRALRMVGTHVDISARKAMELELADAARRDRLTGLANRAVFLEELRASVERVRSGRQACLAVLFLDFDRFKVVNDSLGHEAGDELLRQITVRLRDALQAAASRMGRPDAGIVARFGGDEFLVLLDSLPQAAAAREVAEQLLAALTPAYDIDGRQVFSTASVGIATSDPPLAGADELMRNADMAMYEAKRAGGARAVVFDQAMYLRLTRRLAIEDGLRNRLGNAEFSLAYQPIVDLDTGRTVSVEALARWRHPTLGEVTPSEFVPLAEESGLVVALGAWVLREACAMLAQWRRDDPDGAADTVSINTSRAELALGERFLAQVRAALAESGLPAHCLQIEVTEREVMRDPATSLRLVQQLRGLGVSLAMDDFGTGTSSLACLRDYPFDVIKIDRSFMQDLVAQSDVLPVIHATVVLAENLGRRSIAEGVESAAQVAILQSMGCHYAQGYYFSEPLPSGQLAAWVLKGAARRPSP
jgi:diguanylate cyclase (GGDEF)-like protein/PAS domain S-box-containing protein